MTTEVDQIRDPQGGRNFIRRGDTVRVTPPTRESTFRATFRKALVDDDDNVIEVEVVGAPRGRAPAFRTFRPEFIHRVAQTKDGERREAMTR